MDRFSNKKIEAQTIYEIYRACRLCGAGGGYKMPIIQNVVELDGDIELKQKLRECVHIEVRQDDKMPPLICELCVDKVNDFYEFLEMCQQTNKRTRLRLGLPPQMMPKGVPDAGDCILGITEPIFVDESDEESLPLSEHKNNVNTKTGKETAKVKKKEIKEPELRIKIKNYEHNIMASKPDKQIKLLEDLKQKDKASDKLKSNKLKRRKSISPDAPPRTTRSKVDDVTLNKTQNQQKEIKRQHELLRPLPKKNRPGPLSRKDSPSPLNKKDPPKDTLPLSKKDPPRNDTLRPLSKKDPPKKEAKASRAIKKEEESAPIVKLKRTKDKESVPVPTKKPKNWDFLFSEKGAAHINCYLCGKPYKCAQSLSKHMGQSHLVNYTCVTLACNPCGEWFLPGEVDQHHEWHREKHRFYRCRRCKAGWRLLKGYNDHLVNNKCKPWPAVPEVRCERCWRSFVTDNLRHLHRCLGEQARPGGKCGKCKRTYSTLKSLTKHEAICCKQKKSEVAVPPEVRDRLLPMHVRIQRCDDLLNPYEDSCNVSAVPVRFGLDKECIYPYFTHIPRTRIKAEPLFNNYDHMVDIHNVKLEFSENTFVHWDEESESGSEMTDKLRREREVDSLSVLAIKTLFSTKCLGKVPRKLRKPTKETFGSLFDVTFDTSEVDVRANINSIIDKLNIDKTFSDDDESILKNDDIGNLISSFNEPSRSVDKMSSDLNEIVDRDISNLSPKQNTENNASEDWFSNISINVNTVDDKSTDGDSDPTTDDIVNSCLSQKETLEMCNTENVQFEKKELPTENRIDDKIDLGSSNTEDLVKQNKISIVPITSSELDNLLISTEKSVDDSQTNNVQSNQSIEEKTSEINNLIDKDSSRENPTVNGVESSFHCDNIDTKKIADNNNKHFQIANSSCEKSDIIVNDQNCNSRDSKRNDAANLCNYKAAKQNYDNNEISTHHDNKQFNDDAKNNLIDTNLNENTNRATNEANEFCANNPEQTPIDHDLSNNEISNNLNDFTIKNTSNGDTEKPKINENRDSDLDDRKLMAAIDAQLGENETVNEEVERKDYTY